MTTAANEQTGMSTAPQTRQTHPAWVLAIVAAGLMLATIDLFIVNIAFPVLHRSFHGTPLSTLSWVLNGYTTVFAALLIPAGRLADRQGLKQSFLAGVAVFTGASALCAAANGVDLLIVARVIQATGAAVMIPCSLGLLLAAFPPEGRAGAVRTWAATGGLAAALGPVLGGLLLSVDWRWIFLINLPVGVAALVAGMRWLPAPKPQRESIPDLLGAALLMATIAALTLGLVKAPDWGWSSAWTVTALAGSAAALAVFIVRSARHPSPLVEHGLLRVRSFAVSSLAALLFSASFAALILAILYWAQTVWGWSALRTGLAFAPGPAMVPLFATGITKLAPRVGAGALAVAGTLCFAAAGLDWALAIGLDAHYVTAMLPGTLLSGIGVGLTLPTLTATATSSLPRERFATGSAVISMARQIGYTIGVAILIAVLGNPHSPNQTLHAYRHGWETAALLALLAAVTAAFLVQRPRRAPALQAVPSRNGRRQPMPTELQERAEAT